MATRERLGRNPLLLDEQVDQRLHGLHLLVGDEVVVFGHCGEVDEAHVEHVVFRNVPEQDPVRVVEVRIAAEHLLHDALAVLVERLREATRLADPLVARRRRRRVRGVCRSDLIERKGVWGPGDLPCGKHQVVMDLGDDPFLHAVDEFRGRNLGGTAVHEPRVGQPKHAR